MNRAKLTMPATARVRRMYIENRDACMNAARIMRDEPHPLPNRAETVAGLVAAARKSQRHALGIAKIKGITV